MRAIVFGASAGAFALAAVTLLRRGPSAYLHLLMALLTVIALISL